MTITFSAIGWWVRVWTSHEVRVPSFPPPFLPRPPDGKNISQRARRYVFRTSFRRGGPSVRYRLSKRQNPTPKWTGGEGGGGAPRPFSVDRRGRVTEEVWCCTVATPSSGEALPLLPRPLLPTYLPLRSRPLLLPLCTPRPFSANCGSPICSGLPLSRVSPFPEPQRPPSPRVTSIDSPRPPEPLMADVPCFGFQDLPVRFSGPRPSAFLRSPLRAPRLDGSRAASASCLTTPSLDGWRRSSTAPVDV